MKTTLNASKKRVLKLVLDAIMLILLVLMYRKQAVSMAFHEIGGLALIGLFVIHHLVNGRWIAAATKRFFSKTTSGFVRACYLVNVLLLLAFLAVGVTGVLISKVVFSIHVAGNFKTLHYFSSALAVILMGVHLGLHADYIFGKLLRKGANRIAKIALCAVLAVMIAFGGYSLFTTSFVRYLAAPLQMTVAMQGVPVPSGDIALDGSNAERPTDLSELPEFSGENGDFQNDRQNLDGGEHGSEGGSSSAAVLIAQYVSIVTLFGAVTYGILRLTGRRRQRGQDSAVPQTLPDSAE